MKEHFLRGGIIAAIAFGLAFLMPNDQNRRMKFLNNYVNDIRFGVTSSGSPECVVSAGPVSGKGSNLEQAVTAAMKAMDERAKTSSQNVYKKAGECSSAIRHSDSQDAIQKLCGE